MAITGNQIRAARSLLGLEQVALAEKAGVSTNTIRNMEAAGTDRVRVRTDTLDAVTDALKANGAVLSMTAKPQSAARAFDCRHAD
ncbi:helix-turn-helix domain-containing protein [Ochrobactrum anthropi ATCC 49188]|nr:helix-turn-helix domain-containing protein [Brucella anthropi ATCC 49188]